MVATGRRAYRRPAPGDRPARPRRAPRPGGEDPRGADAGFAWDRGDATNVADIDTVAEGMADTLVAALAAGAAPARRGASLPHRPDRGLRPARRRDDFSGGVGEYVYGREERDFGDMGAPARPRPSGAASTPAPAAAARPAAAGGRMHPGDSARRLEYPSSCPATRATSRRPAPLLPRRNLQVVQPDYLPTEAIDPEVVAAAIRRHIAAFDVDEEREIALALRWQGAPAYERLASFAEGIRRGLAPRIAARQAIYRSCSTATLAQTLGAILRRGARCRKRNPRHRRRRPDGFRLH